jgi:hypothetical protein
MKISTHGREDAIVHEQMHTRKKTYANTFTKENFIDDIVHKWMHARNQSAYALIQTSHITLSVSRCMQDKNTHKHTHKRKHYK